MKARYRVKNSENKTVGFIINDKFEGYYSVLDNIKLVDNLIVSSNGVIKSKQSALPIITLRDINKHEYNKLVETNSIEREIKEKFNEWRKLWSDKVLYVTGARQVGKTTEIKKFAYSNYEQVIYINIANEYIRLGLEDALKSSSISFGLASFCRKYLGIGLVDNKDTVIIIDEIQESYNVYNCIRDIQKGLHCHIIVTGSYLGKIMKSQYFKPVGNVYEVEMLPLSFAEFCKVTGKSDKLFKLSLSGLSNKEDYSELTNLYNIYLSIGGYPDVVKTYIRTKDISLCRKVIKNIVDMFTAESASYFTETKSMAIFDNVYKAAFVMMAREKKGTASKYIEEITNFVKTDVKEHVSRAEVNDALSWLRYSKIIGTCDIYNQAKVSDILNDRRFYFMDCGIANYIASLTTVNNSAVAGILAENFVYMELYRLYKQGILKGDKPCCSIYNNFELDFMLVTKEDYRIGLEVKSTNSDRHKSIDAYIEQKLIDEGYIVEITHGGKGRTVNKIPIYTVGCRFPYN